MWVRLLFYFKYNNLYKRNIYPHIKADMTIYTWPLQRALSYKQTASRHWSVPLYTLGFWLSQYLSWTSLACKGLHLLKKTICVYTLIISHVPANMWPSCGRQDFQLQHRVCLEPLPGPPNLTRLHTLTSNTRSSKYFGVKKTKQKNPAKWCVAVQYFWNKWNVEGAEKVSDSTRLSGTGHRNQNPWHLGLCVLNRKTTNLENDFQIVATTIFHASTLDFFLVVLGLADSLGSGEPGGSVGGLGALSTSGSGSRGIEGPLETPEKQQTQQGRLQREMVFGFWHKIKVWSRSCYVVHISTETLNLSPSDSAFYLKHPSAGEKKNSHGSI